MPTSSGLTVLFLQKMPSALELLSAVPCLQVRRSTKKLGSPVSSSVGPGVKHSPLAFSLIFMENKREWVLCRGRVLAVPMWLSFCCRGKFLAVRLTKAYITTSSALGIRWKEGDAVCRQKAESFGLERRLIDLNMYIHMYFKPAIRKTVLGSK